MTSGEILPTQEAGTTVDEEVEVEVAEQVKVTTAVSSVAPEGLTCSTSPTSLDMVVLPSHDCAQKHRGPNIQVASGSPARSIPIPAELFRMPGSPKTDLEYHQLLASHKLSPKAASPFEKTDLNELKLLIASGPPGLDPPRASEVECARSRGATNSWAAVASRGLEGGASKLEMMDLILMECFLQAVSTRVMAWNLPIKGTTLYTQHMRPCRRIGTSLNVKESTYHNFGAFLAHLENVGLVQLKKGETDAVILDICRHHPEIQSWHSWPLEATVEEFERTESLKRDS